MFLRLDGHKSEPQWLRFSPRTENHSDPDSLKTWEEGPMLYHILITPEKVNLEKNIVGSLVKAHRTFRFSQDSPSDL